MSFDVRTGAEGSTEGRAQGEQGSSAGRLTLSSMLPPASPAPASGGSARAEYGGGDLRASVGGKAEGAHPGMQKGGGGGKRLIGHVTGGSFVRAAEAPQQGAAPAAAAASPTAAQGREGERAYVGTGSSRAADRTANDGTTSVRMEDENDAQATMISAAITRARALLDNAIGKLGSPSSPDVQRALQFNFHSTESQAITEVLSKLQRIRAAFDGTIPIEVEAERDGNTRAYVYQIWSDIHLMPPWFADPDADARARTIIHECSHKYTGTDDEAYRWESAKYAGLSVKDALDNADSYAWFCIDVR